MQILVNYPKMTFSNLSRIVCPDSWDTCCISLNVADIFIHPKRKHYSSVSVAVQAVM